MVENDPSAPLTMESSVDFSNKLSGAWSLYFYVPKGTKVVGGFASTRSGKVLDGDGNPALTFSFLKSKRRAISKWKFRLVRMANCGNSAARRASDC